MTQPDRIAQLKEVYLTLERLQNKLDALQHAQTEPIAIIGLGCRYPNGASSPEAFWSLLRDGRDGITDVPPERWNAAAFYDPRPDRPGKIATRWGGFVDNVAGFDARFFGISPREAAQMDPQQRLLLEVAWEALEAAGQPPDSLAGSATGVYLGLLNSEYGWLQFRDLASLDAYSGTGTSHSVASGRLSYVLGLQGPSVTLDTACSSSLVAIHLACQALRSRECHMALAGGVSLILSPLALMPFSRMGLLAADGRCKVLDASADGFGSGEGCALLVLKRLSDAEAAGDPILALIRGTAVNQDGRTNVLSAPNGRAQAAVIRQALEAAHIAPADLSLVELHGTGTALGDPIETDGLRAVFGRTAQAAARPVYLGAVKSNIGHTGAAAGVAGVVKAVLSLQHDTVPPNLHFRALNPHVNLSGTPFAIPTEPMPWPRGEAPRFAGISAFGWSGTNAHLVLSDLPPRQPAPAPEAPAYVLALSARSEAALRDVAAAHAQHLQSPAGQAQALGHIAYTAAVRRSHHAYRLAVVGHSHAQWVERLRAYLESGQALGVAAGRYHGTRRRRLVFVFSPHGAQWLGMGRALLRASPAFRDALQACQAALQPYVDWNVIDRLESEDGAWLEEIDVLQPCLFAFQVALAAVWRAWGIEPDAVAGHSMGEVAAAHVAGVLSLDDAARIICRRTQLLRGVRGEGAMGVVELSYAQALAAIEPFNGRLTIAASNSPRSTILAGEPAALEALFDQLQAREVFCGWGVADVASHSPRMAGLNEALREAIGAVDRREARLPLYSTVTGDRDDGRQFDAEYWVRHLNQPVLFAATVRRLAESGHDVYLEIGPGPVLGPSIEEGLEQHGREGAVLASLRRGEGGFDTLLETLANLYALGCPVNWSGVYPAGAVVPLPAYPWQRERFWLPSDADTLAAERARRGLGGDVLGERLEVAGEPDRLIWENVYDARVLPQLFEHRLFGRAVLPASAFIEMALAAAEVVGAAGLSDLAFERALTLRDEAPWTEGQVSVDRSGGEAAVRLYSRAGGQWPAHAAARIVQAAVDEAGAAVSPAALREALPEHLDGAAVYQHFEALGIAYGPLLQSVAELRWDADSALARVQLPEATAREAAQDRVPTAGIEPALQAFAWLAARRAGETGALYAPAAVERVTLRQRGVAPAWAHAVLEAATDAALTGRAALLDEAGAPVLTLEGIRFAVIGTTQQETAADWLYVVEWEPAALPDAAPSLAGRWLVFAGPRGLGDALAAALRQHGGEAVVVRPGDALGQPASGAWQIRPDRADDYAALFASVPPDGLRGIVHLWSAEAGTADPAPEAVAAHLTRHPAHVLQLVQAIKQAAPEAAVPLWLVTAGAQPAAGALVRPEQAAVWGLGYVLAEEHHELWGGLVDLDAVADPASAAAQLCREIGLGAGEDRVAWRGEQRYVARLARLGTAEAAPARRPFRPDGAYLITGGFGDIALTVARWAVAHGARRLILLGRSALPPRAQWRTLDPVTAAGRRALAIQALEAAGAAVHWAAVDVGDAGALTAYLDAYAAEGWPAIRGVLHAAAVIEDRLLVELDAGSLQRVAHAKAAGAWHLHQYFRSTDLDFFVLFSSSGSLMGAAGQANYALANAALDAVAHARRAGGLHALSINWGFWQDLGFATTAGGRRAVAYMAASGLHPFTPAEALDALGHLLARPDLNQAAAMKVDWERWRAQARLVGVPPLLRRMAEAQPDQAARPEAAGDIRAELFGLEPGPARRRRLQDFIRGQLAGVLRLPSDAIDVDTPLGSLGIDSFTAIELRNRFERALGLSLSATLAWNYPTIAAMTPYLADKMGLPLEPEPAAADGGSPAALDDDLAAFLAQVETLSEDDLRRLLDDGESEAAEGSPRTQA